METQILRSNSGGGSNGEINILNRNSTDNIRLSSPIYNEKILLEQQELMLKQQLMNNQQRQKQLKQIEFEEQEIRNKQLQSQLQQQLTNSSNNINNNNKDIHTSFYVTASRAILTNKYISLMTKSLSSSSSFSTLSTMSSLEIENLSKLVEIGYFKKDEIPDSDYTFINDEICIYDPYSIFFINSDESKQLLIDNFQLFYQQQQQQQTNNYSLASSSSSSPIITSANTTTTYKELINKSNPIKSWLEFQKSVSGGNKSISRIGFRTKYIDQLIMDNLNLKGSIAHFNASAFFYTQVVIFGAGFDCRSLRLPIDKHISVFEIDLPSVLNYKKQVLSTATNTIKTTSKCKVNYIEGDISKEGDRWIGNLLDCGFNPAMHTLWVMESLIMYLTEDEINTLLGSIGMLSSPNSKLIVHTVASESTSSSSSSSSSSTTSSATTNTNNFVSYHSSPADLLKQFGFSKDITSVSYSDLNKLYQCNNQEFNNNNNDYSKFSTGIFTG